MSKEIIEKIKKLFALAADKGATEEEAATAMRLASGLMMRHGIEKDQLEDLDVSPKARRLANRLDKYELVIANASARLYGCTAIFWDSGKGGITFYGREENIEACQATLFFLLRQIENLYKQSLPKGLDQRERGNYRKTFKWSCALRVESRVAAMLERMTTNNQAASETGSTALVVKSHIEKLKQEAESIMPEFKVKTMTQRSGSGSAAGRAAGDKVKLREELR